MGTSSAWTPERRQRQRDAIRRWQPWAHSTGPRTETGKARSSLNAGRPAALIELDAMLAQAQVLHDLMEYVVLSRGARPLSGRKVIVDRKRLDRLRQSLAAQGAFEPSFLSQFMRLGAMIDGGDVHA